MVSVQEGHQQRVPEAPFHELACVAAGQAHQAAELGQQRRCVHHPLQQPELTPELPGDVESGGLIGSASDERALPEPVARRGQQLLEAQRQLRGQALQARDPGPSTRKQAGSPR